MFSFTSNYRIQLSIRHEFENGMENEFTGIMETIKLLGLIHSLRKVMNVRAYPLFILTNCSSYASSRHAGRSKFFFEVNKVNIGYCAYGFAPSVECNQAA